MKPSSILTGALLALGALGTPLATAQSLPTPEQFKPWDAKFKPGLYVFVDHALDKDGQPKEKGSNPREECIDRGSAYLLGRGTRFADPFQSCQMLNAKLDARGLVMAHNCSGPEEKKRPLIGTLLVTEVEPGTFMALASKQVHNREAPDSEPVSGVAHLFKRIGSCK